MGDRAKITKADGYRIAIDGNNVVTFPMGTIVDGRVAMKALEDKAASRMFDPVEQKKVVAPSETKAKKAPRKRSSK